jgi:hypothetical protein
MSLLGMQPADEDKEATYDVMLVMPERKLATR